MVRNVLFSGDSAPDSFTVVSSPARAAVGPLSSDATIETFAVANRKEDREGVREEMAR